MDKYARRVCGQTLNTASCPICEEQRPSFFQSKIPYCARSDWQPIKDSIEIFYCQPCHHFFKDQAFVDRWSDYQNYQAFGEGQTSNPSYDPGWPEHRAKALLQYLSQHGLLHKKSKILDFGCHHGQFLKYFEGNQVGFDINPKYRTQVELSGHTFVEHPDQLNSQAFDFIFLLHVFEHLESPFLLKNVLHSLKPDGAIILQVPDPYIQIPDFYVADHRNHFTKKSLQNSVSKMGLVPALPITRVVPSEWTAVFKMGKSIHPAEEPTPDALCQRLGDSEVRIQEIMDNPEELIIFGTGYTGIMLAKNFEKQTKAFIDDNLNLQGQTFFGKEVYSMEKAPLGKWVLGIPPISNNKIIKRCKDKGIDPLVLFESAKEGKD